MHDEVNKQRQVAVKKSKELEAQLAHLTHIVSEFEKEQESKFLELEKCKEQMEKIHKQLEVSRKEKEELANQVEEFNLQKKRKVEE